MPSWRRRASVPLLVTAGVAVVCLALGGCGGATPVPAPPPQAARPISFTTDDGLEIKGQLFGQGHTGLILAHMFPSDQTSWWEFAEVLAEKGYIALTFNFRGYGEGASKSGGDKEISLIDRDLEAALAFLKGQGASSMFLVGASMGGTVSLKVATRQPVDGVISLSSPVEFKGISLKGMRVLTPVLLMATQGDKSARRSLESMVEDGIVGEQAETVIFDKGSDHSTDILKGKNAAAARERILSFIEAHVR